MTDSGPSPGDVARYLRQQGELGGAELFLGELDRQEALALTEKREQAAGAPLDPGLRPETHPVDPGALPAGAAGESDQASEKMEGLAERPTGSPDYEKARQRALTCQKCGLAKTRGKVVFSDGNPAARLMVVGEAPGAQEDKTGLAFVGPAGKLLDLLLASVDLSRKSSAYICNILKCRPPGNRNPLPEEIQACTPFLQRQIELVSPEAILAVGTFSGQFLTGKPIPLGRLRGEVYSYQGVPVVVTYHPAALLRNPGWTQATWDDLQLLRQVMAGA